MKRKMFVLGIILGLLIPTLAIAGSGNSSPSMYGADVSREQLVSTLDTTESETSGLPEEIPFWVDLVNSEDVSEDGEGVYIAVLDTGLVSLWPLFFPGANIVDELGIGFTHDVTWDNALGDFVFGPLRDDRGFITDDVTGSGHGTHVVSTIVGYAFYGSTSTFWVKGVAPRAKIIPVLVLDEWLVTVPGGVAALTGGTDEMVSAGILYVADLAEDLDGPVIISMSLGGPTPSPMIEEAIDYAISKGVIVVASAGNSGYDGMGWPGAYPQVISTGMAGWTEQFTYGGWWLSDVPEKLNTKDSWGNNWQLFLDYLSSRPNKNLGQKSFHLDVTTPGCAIVGPYKSYFQDNLGYYYLWGTSMAAPHVSGMASLVLQNHPDLSQREMEKLLKVAANGLPLSSDGSAAIDFPPDYFWYFNWYGTDYGSGFLQANKALKAAK
ncbi:MAG: S8 family peptidase [Promethearchaeota archaeon]